MIPTATHLATRTLTRLRGLWSTAALDRVEERMGQLARGTSDAGSEWAPLRVVTGEAPLAPAPDVLGGIVGEHLSTGGKRLRARLALGSAEALGCDRLDVVPWAVACELLHNASLIHDDLQDGDRVRRGQPSVWVRHGVAQAINAGDLCLMLPFDAIGDLDRGPEVKWDLTHCLSHHAARMVRGQAAELELLAQNRLDWESYAEAVEGKTASLFVLPVLGAARIAGRSRRDAEALARPFNAIGLLFQIQDDLLDLWGDKGRGEVGSDLREGKVSALVAEHLRLHPRDTPWLVTLLKTPRAETGQAAVDEAIARFATGGAFEAVWERIDRLEDDVVTSSVLESEPRLHALAIELVAQALAPVARTAPPRST